MIKYLEHNPPTLTFEGPFQDLQRRLLVLQNNLDAHPLIFLARVQNNPSCFAVSAPKDGLGIIAQRPIPHDKHSNGPVGQIQSVDVWVESALLEETVSDNAVMVYWCAILPSETATFVGDRKAEMFANVWHRAQTNPSMPRGSLRVPIEIVDPVSINAIETGKDPLHATNRPGLGGKQAKFRPLSCQHHPYGYFTSAWTCEMKLEEDNESSGDEMVEKEIVIKEMNILSPSWTITLDYKLIQERTEPKLQAWTALDHPNVAPLLGYLMEPKISIIMTKYEHNDVLEYVQTTAYPPGTTLLENRCVRIRLAKEVTYGLLYLHSQNVIHGDLHHIVVGRNFYDGFSTGPAEMTRDIAANHHLPKRSRFAAYLKPESPFWDLFYQCCSLDPGDRPSIEEVVDKINAISFLEDVFFPIPAKIYRMESHKGNDTAAAKEKPREDIAQELSEKLVLDG
ncbi:LIM domain kinase 2 [Tulasnella sp. 427]|nr:LIM domain kinase 2 [Tulasnella sp. 427]